MLSSICIRGRTKIAFGLSYFSRLCSSIAKNVSSISYPTSAALSDPVRLSKEFCGDSWSFETGRFAPIADASCLAKQNENFVLVTVARSLAVDSSVKKDFVSLQVDYKEEASAGGFIPGTYNRRDTFVTDKEILTARAIDRSLRPLLPGSLKDELQLTCNVFSAKGDKDTDVLSLNAASMALLLSSVPFEGPVGAVRVSRIDDNFVINPSFVEYGKSSLNLLYACTRYKTVMIELDSNEVPISILKDALRLAHEKAREMIDFQQQFMKRKTVLKMDTPLEPRNESLLLAAKRYESAFEEIFSPRDGRYLTKMERRKALTELNEKALRELSSLFTSLDSQELASYLHEVEHQVFRRLALQSSSQSSCAIIRRCDGRYSDQLRPLRAQVELFPVVHGSSMFERGDTQVVGVTTIGPTERALKMQSYAGGAKENKFMVHYRFPPYCNGQVGTSYGRNRREVGHGALVEKALRFLMDIESFPYVVRVNVIATGSDGSTSMASICAASLSLMDAGVPLKKAVAGISIGLIWNGTETTTPTSDSIHTLFEKPENSSSEYLLLTDILGIEDHHGDMDFKIAGTKQGITACQLDVKVKGIPPFIVLQALEHASSAHQRILSTMDECLSEPRLDLRPNAPRSSTLYIEPLLRSSLLGVGGYKLRSIVEETQADIQVDDNGKVDIEAPSLESYQKAVKRIYEIVGDLVPGTQFQGKITDIRDYGVMVELFQGREGLVHVSELSDKKVLRATELGLQVGQPLLVEVIAYDRKRGQVKLSHRKTKQVPEKQ